MIMNFDLKSCLSGAIGHDVRQACAEITGIANFLSSRKANQKNISEWHILAAVLGESNHQLLKVSTWKFDEISHCNNLRSS